MPNWKTGSHSLVACFTSDNGSHTMSARLEERRAEQPGSVLARAIKRPKIAVTKSMCVCPRREWCKRLSKDCTRTWRWRMWYQQSGSSPLAALSLWITFRIRLMDKIGTWKAGAAGEDVSRDSRPFSKWNRLWRRIVAGKKRKCVWSYVLRDIPKFYPINNNLINCWIDSWCLECRQPHTDAHATDGPFFNLSVSDQLVGGVRNWRRHFRTSFSRPSPPVAVIWLFVA